MVNHDGLDSLLSVKKALEAKIEEALNAVAVLRKKHDAITSAIDMLDHRTWRLWHCPLSLYALSR